MNQGQEGETKRRTPQFVSSFFRFMRSKRSAKVGVGILVAYLLFVIVGTFLTPYSPSASTITRDSPPSLAHPFGTDFDGHDLLSQVVFGAYPSLFVGLGAALGAVLIGVLIGVIGGYFGKLEAPLSGITDVILTFPPLPLMILIGSIYPATDLMIMGVLIVVLWPVIARAIRAQVLSLKQRPFVETARVSGMSDFELIWKVIIPEIVPLAIAYFVLTVASAIVFVTALQFLGVGNPNEISWGSTLYWAQQFAFYSGDWWWILAPGLSVTLVATAFALIGFSTEEVMNPRLRT